jgi:hypothetical protein
VEVVIRIALMFFFIQFLVIVTSMVVSLLVARPEVPLPGREPGSQALRRSLAFVTQLPVRAVRSAVRVAHAAHSWRATR